MPHEAKELIGYPPYDEYVMSEIDKALDNLSAIKEGNDPRKQSSESVAVQQTPTAKQEHTPLDAAGPLSAARREVDRLWREHELEDVIPRGRICVAVARWKSRLGHCRYNQRLEDDRFGEKVTGFHFTPGSFSIIINEKIWEQDEKEEFIDTVRHEVAHAIAYKEYDGNQKHNYNWKRVARKLGATPKSCGNKMEKEGDYIFACPNGCWEGVRTRRSKLVKRPWDKSRYCKRCGATPVACDSGIDPTTLEPGEVQVTGVPWTNKEEWIEHQK